MQIVVDLSRLRHNIRSIRSKLKNKFCAVIKANGYGHGNIAPYIDPIVDCYLVATYAEAGEVILSGVKKPVMVLDGDLGKYDSNTDRRIIPAVSDARGAEYLIKVGCKNFSVAVNTGMNRLGADERRLSQIVDVCKMNGVRPWSVYSHIYGGMSSAEAQSNEFDRLTRGEPMLCRLRHLYSSCALDVPENYLYDMTRCGIAMYGFADGLDSAIKVRAKITAISRVSAGEHVGYGTFVLDRDATVATLRMGYADGLRRTDRPLYFTVRGEKCPVLGKSCMDMCMIDVSKVNCRVGEYAYLISQKSDVEYLAKIYDSIVYEVLTGFNGRAERFYI